MKNVGIITFHRSYNYGSALQAYALQSCIEGLGYSARIIDYVMKEDFEQYKIFRTKYYKKNIRSLASDVVFLLPHLKRRKSFRKFIGQNLELTDRTYFSNDDMKHLNDEMDIFVCGSDQIWNFDCTDGVEKAYFLDFADKKKIAYAPSLGHVSFDDDYSGELKPLLAEFDHISVREESTVPYIQTMTDKEVEAVLDPTLLLDAKQYESITSEIKSGKFIFVYMLEYNAELISYCRQIQENTGYELCFVSQKVNCGIDVGKNVFGISPCEFLGYIKNAEFVITNSFHATVFSVLFNKKFCTAATKKSYSRMTDLLAKLGIEERLYRQGFDIEKEIDYTRVMEKLNLLRKKSMDFLSSALKEDE